MRLRDFKVEVPLVVGLNKMEGSVFFKSGSRVRVPPPEFGDAPREGPKMTSRMSIRPSRRRARSFGVRVRPGGPPGNDVTKVLRKIVRVCGVESVEGLWAGYG